MLFQVSTCRVEQVPPQPGNKGRRRYNKPRYLQLLFFALLLWPASLAHAQVGLDAEFAGFGARAMAMGGAFIGLADDATAAEYNPAGLVILERPELALQMSYMVDRHRELQPMDFAEWFPAGGSSAPRAIENSRYLNPSFMSFVYPTRWGVFSFSSYSPVYLKRGITDRSRFNYLNRDWRSQLTNYSVSGGFAPHPKLYLGCTLKYGDFYFRQRDRTPSGTVSDSFKGNGVGGNFGFLMQLHPWVTLGCVYKTSQRFSGEVGGKRWHPRIPATTGLGLAVKPNDRLRIVADVDRIEWSEFLKVRNYRRDDVTRYHVGTEYLLGVFGHADPTAVFLRGGAMKEQSNKFYYTGSSNLLGLAYPKGESVTHLSWGLGLARDRYQVDFAMDTSDKGEQYILSTILYF